MKCTLFCFFGKPTWERHFSQACEGTCVCSRATRRRVEVGGLLVVCEFPPSNRPSTCQHQDVVWETGRKLLASNWANVLPMLGCVMEKIGGPWRAQVRTFGIFVCYLASGNVKISGRDGFFVSSGTYQAIYGSKVANFKTTTAKPFSQLIGPLL